MAKFTLATGLRKRNVTLIDMEKRQAWIHPDQAKATRAIAVPLNEEAIEVLQRERGKHSTRVFAYRGRPVNKAKTKAWRAALRKARIDCISRVRGVSTPQTHLVDLQVVSGGPCRNRTCGHLIKSRMFPLLASFGDSKNYVYLAIQDFSGFLRVSITMSLFSV